MRYLSANPLPPHISLYVYTYMQGRLGTMARELVGVMTMASKVLKRVPKDRLSVAGVSKGVGTVTKSVVSSQDVIPSLLYGYPGF